MGVIDALGGIDVNSDVAFNTVGMEVPDEDGSGNSTSPPTRFQQGLNHLDGRQALAFARERDAFDDGDMQRGRNQMLVIRASSIRPPPRPFSRVIRTFWPPPPTPSPPICPRRTSSPW